MWCLTVTQSHLNCQHICYTLRSILIQPGSGSWKPTPSLPSYYISPHAWQLAVLVHSRLWIPFYCTESCHLPYDFVRPSHSAMGNRASSFAGRVIRKTSFPWHRAYQTTCIHLIYPTCPSIVAAAVWMYYGKFAFRQNWNLFTEYAVIWWDTYRPTW